MRIHLGFYLFFTSYTQGCPTTAILFQGVGKRAERGWERGYQALGASGMALAVSGMSALLKCSQAQPCRVCFPAVPLGDPQSNLCAHVGGNSGLFPPTVGNPNGIQCLIRALCLCASFNTFNLFLWPCVCLPPGTA